MRRREQSALRKIRAMAPLERKRFLRSLAANSATVAACRISRRFMRPSSDQNERPVDESTGLPIVEPSSGLDVESTGISFLAETAVLSLTALTCAESYRPGRCDSRHS